MALESFKRINDLDLNPEKDLIQIYNKKTDTMGVINPSQISTPLPSGVLSVDNPLSSTLQPIEDKSGTASALSISTNRVGLASDPSVTTQSSSVIAASTTNANLVIAPNGTGALIASVPDGTILGGNARGANAVDLQLVRTQSSNRVAGGTQSFIGGGLNNQVTVTRGIVVGGEANAVLGTGGAIVGGESNTINGGAVASFIGGGLSNSVGTSSTYSVVSGGQSNTASTNTHATVVGGKSNTSSGEYSISGGNGNTASGNNSLALGLLSVAQGSYSFAIGYQAKTEGSHQFSFGEGNTLTSASNYSMVSGYGGKSYLRTQVAHSARTSFNNNIYGGNCQYSNLIAAKSDTLTTGGTTVLSLDGTGVTNLIIPEGNNRMWNVQVRWVAVVTAITGTATGVTVGDTKTSTDLLAVAKRGGVTTVSAHTSAGTHAIETVAGSLTAANIAYTAGASQEMAITFTGPTFGGLGSVTMRVVAAISLTEVAY